jgi:hypothetical protein
VALVEWNLERKGVPIPANAEGLASLDALLLISIQRGWFDQIASIPRPFASVSTAGDPSADRSESPNPENS